jgi:hypothetical protein
MNQTKSETETKDVHAKKRRRLRQLIVLLAAAGFFAVIWKPLVLICYESYTTGRLALPLTAFSN